LPDKEAQGRQGRIDALSKRADFLGDQRPQHFFGQHRPKRLRRLIAKLLPKPLHPLLQAFLCQHPPWLILLVIERDLRRHDLSKRGSQPYFFCARDHLNGLR
jgi:hypothetical protein